MSPMRLLLPAGIGLLFLIAPAFAQTPGQRIIVEQSASSPRQEGSVRIQSSINLILAGPSGEGRGAEAA
jgi:hypothetical protein